MQWRRFTCIPSQRLELTAGPPTELVLAGNIIRTAFTSNTAGQKGGAVFGETSTGNIMNSTFTTNKASQAGGAGGLRSSGCSLPQGLDIINEWIWPYSSSE